MWRSMGAVDERELHDPSEPMVPLSEATLLAAALNAMLLELARG